MEGLGTAAFRNAYANTIGGFDEACTEFIRVPINAHIESLAKAYHPYDTHPIPQAAQIMGGNPTLMGDMAALLAQKGAHRVDLNCGCPSNTVTGRGAGSSLLKTPDLLHKIACSMVQASPVPITVKMRSGFDDTSLFIENLKAIEEAGAHFVTLHPRTKVEGYRPPANWDLIRKAKEIVSIPVIGNGDIKTASDAEEMLHTTHCDGLMIGRGALSNPWIFHQIKEKLFGTPFAKTLSGLEDFLHAYHANLMLSYTLKSQIGHLKQLFAFLFQASPELENQKRNILRMNPLNSLSYLNTVLAVYKNHTDMISQNHGSDSAKREEEVREDVGDRCIPQSLSGVSLL